MYIFFQIETLEHGSVDKLVNCKTHPKKVDMLTGQWITDQEPRHNNNQYTTSGPNKNTSEPKQNQHKQPTPEYKRKSTANGKKQKSSD